jgi:hypothetical protein
LCAQCHVWSSAEVYELEVTREKAKDYDDLERFWKELGREKKVFMTGYRASIEVLEIRTILGVPAARIRIVDGACTGREGWLPAYPDSIYR